MQNKFQTYNIMIKRNLKEGTVFDVNESYEGETIEMKMRRVIGTGEAISDGAPVIYTKRSEGVLPQYDIRTDRWDIAIDAMDKVTKTNVAKRIEFHSKKNEEVGGTESIQAT